MWTDEDTAAYWAEVHREAERDAWLSRRLIDPLGHTYYRIPAHCSSYPYGVAADDWYPLWEVNIKRALSLLPITDREVLAPSAAAAQQHPNVSNVTRIQRRNRAGHRLALVAPWATRGWDARRIIRSVIDRDKALVKAYLDTWTTTGAAKVCGVSQYIAYMRLKKIGEAIHPEGCGAVIGAIMNRPEISNTKASKRSNR